MENVKTIFGFIKKDQAPLTGEDKELAETVSSCSAESTSSSDSTSSSASSSAKDSKDAQGSKDAKPKVTKGFEAILFKYTAEIKGLPQLLVSEITQTKDRIAAFDDSDRSRRIANDTKIHQEFSASKSGAAFATTTAAPSPSVDEFEGFEDEPPTETTSTPQREETLDPPVYTEADLIKPQSLYDSISEWPTSNLSEQEKLDITSDPVLLTKDLKAKAKELQDLQVGLIMESMKQPFKSKRLTAKTKRRPSPRRRSPNPRFRRQPRRRRLRRP